MEDAREARRKRILARGSDRLAFITGASGPDSPSLKERFLRSSSEISVAPRREDDGTSSHFSDQSRSSKDASDTVGERAKMERSYGIRKSCTSDELLASEKEDNIIVWESGDEAEVKAPQSDSEAEVKALRSDSEAEVKAPRSDSEAEVKALQSDEEAEVKVLRSDKEAEVQVLPSDREAEVQALRSDREAEVQALRSDRNSELLSTAVAQRSLDQVVDTVASTTRVMKQMLSSPKQVSLSVSASENIRLLCAVIIALLVVLANHGYALGGAVVSSVINFRPLFLVMLTDVTIVLGLLMASQQTDEKEKERAKTVRQDDGWAGNIGDTLEAWLIIQKVTSAIFMDCSICAVIMIIGLCI